jgi:hypothetical protein
MLEYHRIEEGGVLGFAPMPEIGIKNVGFHANSGYWSVKMIAAGRARNRRWFAGGGENHRIFLAFFRRF